jgi:hypothetical protein
MPSLPGPIGASGIDVVINNGGIFDETPLNEVEAASLMNLFQ